MSPLSLVLLQYRQSSTVLSVGSIRQQFSTKGNVLMSLYSSHFLKNISAHLQLDKDPLDIPFQEEGYLFLASEEGERVLRENYELQTSVGASVELLDPQGLQRRFPWINTEGIVLASLGMWYRSF